MLYRVLLRVGVVGVAGGGRAAGDGDGESAAGAGMIVGGVGDSDGEGAGAGGFGCGSVRGAAVVVVVVVGWCWVSLASCVALMLARVSYVLCWVLLGLLVLQTVGAWCWMLAQVRVPWVLYWVLLPLVSPLALCVSVGEGVVGGAVGVGAAALGSGCGHGRGWLLGFAGCGPSPPLAEGLVGGGAGWVTRVSYLSWWRARGGVSYRSFVGFSVGVDGGFLAIPG